MKQILRYLYFGELTPWENRPIYSTEGIEAQKACEAKMELLRNRLSEKDIRLLEEMLSDRSVVFSDELVCSFSDGFCLGVRLILEVLEAGFHE